MSVTVFYNRKTGEVFAVDDVESFRKDVFESGTRNEKDFEMASATGCIRIRPMLKGKEWAGTDVTTIDAGNVL